VNDATLNVLYVLPHGEMGGLCRFLDAILPHHSEAVRPVVLAFREGSWLKEIRDRGVKVYTLDHARIREPIRCFRAISRILRDERIQIVNSAYAWCHSIAAPAAARHGARRMWTHYGPMSASRWQGLMPLVPADLLLTHESMLDAMRRTFYRARRLGAVPVALDAARMPPDTRRRERFRRAWGLDERTLAVGIVGFIDTWKGQDIFVRAAKLIAPEAGAFRMFVVGGPRDGVVAARCVALEKELREYVAANRLEETVTFTGHLDVNDGALDGLDLVVHASIEPEPLGMVVLEAMAKGKPIIASNEGGPRALLTDGIDGLLIEPRSEVRLAATIMRLARDRGERERMGVAALATVRERFSPRMAAQKLEDWYSVIA
jgi:glycosyltransferase involved in cell wall biosynthesis